MLDLSVIVPTHNRHDYLPALLESLTNQNYPADRWELVIIDDGSSDGTAEFLGSYAGSKPANMRVISQPQSGVATARNNGVLVAKGRAVLFLDDDMLATPTLVGEHASVHLSDSSAVVIGHISVPASGREAWVAWEDIQLERHYKSLAGGSRIPGPRDFYTGNCSVSTALFGSVGGFDSSLPRTEDVDLGYRLKAAGAHFYYRQKADSLHLGRHGFANWLRNARIYGHTDVWLAWEKGNVELQESLLRWFKARPLVNRALVEVCARVPPLQKPTIGLLHLVGNAAYKLNARSLSKICYSLINNLAYWLGVGDGLRKSTLTQRKSL